MSVMTASGRHKRPQRPVISHCPRAKSSSDRSVLSILCIGTTATPSFSPLEFKPDQNKLPSVSKRSFDRISSAPVATRTYLWGSKVGPRHYILSRSRYSRIRGGIRHIQSICCRSFFECVFQWRQLRCKSTKNESSGRKSTHKRPRFRLCCRHRL